MEAHTRTGKMVYTRMDNVKNSVDEFLRSELRKMSDNIDWSTETITLTEEKADSTCGCEDRLLVSMTVNENEL